MAEITEFVELPGPIIQEALDEAEESTMAQSHGAVIYDPDTGDIISSGHNQKVGPLDDGRTVHAEAAAIGSAPKNTDFSELHLFALRLSQGDNIRGSAPCNHCRNLLKACGIEKVYHT